MKRKVAHNEEQRLAFIAKGYTPTGEDENGNSTFWSNDVEDVLSKRELQVYNLRANAIDDISIMLGISTKSVENYQFSIKRKGF